MEIAGLLQIAGKQHGCFTRRQALETMTRNQLAYLVSTGAIQRRRQSVYVVTGSSQTWRQRVAAAVLSVPGYGR